MCSQSEFHYQFPSLLEAIEFSPSFFLSLFDHFDKYIKSIEKIFPTVLNYQKYIEYMSKSLELVHKTSSTASEMHAINQLHKPLIQDIFAKLENISKLSLLPSNSIELFKTNCINTLNLQINKFRKFMDFKFELEEINKIFFDCLVDKKNHELIVSSHNSMNEKHATLYDRLLLKYKIFIVRFTKKLRARIRELDVAIYMSSSYYLSEISKLHVTVIEKPLNPSNESTTALEFILKNNQRDKEADQNELRKILNQLPQYDTDITQQDNTILTNDVPKLLATGKNIGAAARRHAVKGINFLDSLIPKAIRPEVSQFLPPHGYNVLNINLHLYIHNRAPCFQDGFKYDDKKQIYHHGEGHDLFGYLCLTVMNLDSNIYPKNNKLLYGILDKKNGIFWGQGLEDKSPIPLFYLCHCLVVDDQSNLSSTSFEIVSYSCHMSIKAPSFRDKNLWVSEIKLGIESSLKSVKYKIQDYHISISDEENIYKNPLQVIYSQKENNKCADCNSSDPEWANYHQGVTICSDCAGAHRHYGSNNNHVRSLLHDYWNDKNLDHMLSCGNAKINSILEAKLGEYFKPNQNSDMNERIKFVGKKYHEKEFSLNSTITMA